MPTQDYSNQSENYRRQLRSFFEQLHNVSRNDRDATVRELQTLERSMVLDVLKEMLHDVDGDVRCDAAETLVRIDSESGVPLLLLLLEDSLDGVRYHVCGLLHDFGDERAIGPLTKVILNDPEGGVRHIACYALGEIADTRALPALRWVQQNDAGMGYEGRRVSEMAREAIQSILSR